MTSFAALAPFPVLGKWQWDEMQFKWLLMKWWLHFVVWNVRPAEMLIRWWQSRIQVIVDCCWILHMFCCDFIFVITVTVGHFGGTTFTFKADNYAGPKGHLNCECSQLQINSCLIGCHFKSVVSHQHSAKSHHLNSSHPEGCHLILSGMCPTVWAKAHRGGLMMLSD